MPNTQTDYAAIKRKIQEMKDIYPSLRTKPDHYVFSALCVKSNYFKNPALQLNDSDFESNPPV